MPGNPPQPPTARRTAPDGTGSLSILSFVQLLSPGPGGGPVGGIKAHLWIIPAHHWVHRFP
eukprot:scaffold45312_cov16-Tisochrysis_lutea.AAC.4